MAFNAFKINFKSMKRHYETDKVKKSDFTVKVLRVESSVNTLTNHCENALYEVNADIYYKGNRIESFFCLCPFGKCKNSEPDENGDFSGFLPEWKEMEAQLNERLNHLTASGITLDEIFGDLVLDQYIRRVLRRFYNEFEDCIPDNRLAWTFEKLQCMLCVEDDECHLIIGPSLEDLEKRMFSPITEEVTCLNNEKIFSSDKLFVSNQKYDDI